MKKMITITFEIYQDDLDKQKPNLTIYSGLVPENLNKVSIEELKLSGFKKMIKLKPEKEEEMNDRFAKRYIFRIPHEKIMELFN